MINRIKFVGIIVLMILPGTIRSQVKSPFSGDPAKYRTEMTALMGPNLNDAQKANLNSFLTKWDSTAFSDEIKLKIIDLTSQMHGRAMRPVPHFNNFIDAINTFVGKNAGTDFLTTWLTGFSETIFNPRLNNDNIDRFVRNSSLMIRDNILSETSTFRWKVKNCKLDFKHDTLFYIEIKNATLTCYAQKDSTEIYNVTGIYYPEIQQFRGTKGKITWEKAGYGPEEVFAESDNYIINTTKNNFTIDSARLTHNVYFKTPVSGVLNDQAISIRKKENATFPRFETYTKEFKLENVYKGVNYEGGLVIEGASIKGTGTKAIPAKVTLYRNDTLYLKLSSVEYLFTKSGMSSSETGMTLFLDKDSIFHTNLGFSYQADKRLVNLYRANNPVSKSPYFDSFHNLDMYFELLAWDMNESKIMLTRPRGAALGMAEFESTSFFDINYYNKLAGIDQYHPLNRLRKFADWYYSDTFPVEEFAKWLNKPVEAATALCIDMANKGFVFYDRKFNEVTLKKKVDDFLTSRAKKKDYDVLYFTSETKAPLDNAILDLKNYRITVNGVKSVFLSDSQRVAIFPYNQQIVIGKNRNLEFDGVVEAGLFTIFGHQFSFNYDTFKIRLQKIDSIRISVETDQKDANGNPLIHDVDNLIQLGTAELYIDNPDNKSGLRSLKQYPIINAITYSYIFYDAIPGLEGIYSQKDFYFRVDPFSYDNIDHYTNADMNLAGEFHGGKILKPMRQYLTIQENNSLGFNMNIPPEGIEVYEGKGKVFDNINMSNKGLVGSGTLKHLTSTTTSDEFRFFPDSMLAKAKTFKITEDGAGIYPETNTENASIMWLTDKDEWLAYNAEDKNFNMFGNGTMLTGNLSLKPGSLNGSGIIGTTDSRITSNLFRFTSNSIKADTSIYNFKSPSTSGYAFIAENAKTDVNFELKRTTFHLNTDTSVVKFPEIQYICKMTDFSYNMETKVLGMEQKGKSDTPLLTPDKLLLQNNDKLEKPTFLATNVIGDTIAFSSWKGSYHIDGEFIEAENINYIHIADALIQPDKGKIVINRRAKIKPLENAIVAINNRHLLHDAKIDIESTKRYSGSAVYDYVDENKDIQQITFPELKVDTLVSSARGFIPVSQKFMLNPAFSFSGDVNLYASKNLLTFTGAAGIVHNCSRLKSYSLKFKSTIDPKNVMIPVSEKPRDINDNMVFSGSFINLDSIHIYPAFLSAQKSWTDVGIVKSEGYLYYEKAKGRYILSSLEKIADPTINGNMIALDKNFCVLSGEGKLDLGTNFDLARMIGAGKIIHRLDSGDVRINAILAFDFFFSPEALKIMSDDIRLMPSLKPVNLNSEFYKKAMKDMLGSEAAAQINDEINLFGTSKNLPKDFNYEIVLNDVNLYWNESTSSFRSEGKIGIGFIGQQPLNVYVDGFVEIQRRRSGDMFDIYLKADESTYYYFSYIRGNMMTQSGNNNYNVLISNLKANDRKHPDSTVRQPYIYMISVEDRLARFLRRMTSVDYDQSETVTPENQVR
jgi:hypothetical protein